MFNGQNKGIISIDLSDDFKYIATAFSNNSVQVWDIKYQDKVAVYEEEAENTTILGSLQEQSIILVRFLLAQSSIVFVKVPGIIKIWDYFKHKITFEYDTQIVINCLLVMENQSEFIFASASQIYRISAENNKCRLIIDICASISPKIGMGMPQCFGFGQPNSYEKRLSIMFPTQGVRMNNFNNGLYGYNQPQPLIYIKSIILTADKRILALGSSKIIHIFEFSTEKIIIEMKGLNGDINSLAFTLNEKILVSLSSDNIISLWSMDNGNQIKFFDVNPFKIQSILNCKQNFIALSQDSKIGLFNIKSNKIEFKTLIMNYKFNSIASTFDKKLIGYVNDTAAVILDLDKWEEKYNLEGHKAQITFLDISSDQDFAITCSEGKKNNLMYWDLKSGLLRANLQGHTKSVLCASLSNNNYYAASLSNDYSIKLWNLQKLELEYDFKPQNQYPTYIKFMNNSEDFVSGFINQNLISLGIWNIKSKNMRSIHSKNIVFQYEEQNNPDTKIILTDNDSHIIFCIFNFGIIICNIRRNKCELESCIKSEVIKFIKKIKISFYLVERYLILDS